MQLCDLPDDVLRLVIKGSLKTCGGTAAILKANLPLLAVCRRWRQFALPTVYSGVTICYNLPSRRREPGNAHENNADDEPGDAKITTNLDLVISAGCVHMVRQVNLFVEYKSNLLPGLGALIQLMRTAAEQWEGVERLDVVASPGGIAPARRINVADYRGDIRHISVALASTMPMISCLSLNGCFADPISRELDGRLAFLYSHHLGSLVSRRPVIVPPDHTFRSLKNVSIRYKDNTGYQHPRVDPTKLVSLELSLWPSNHSWAPFSADGDSGAIEFPNLKSLSVMYRPADVVDGAAARHRDGHPWKLHFPNLDRLSVICGQEMCPLLEYAVLPPRMGEIFVGGATPALVRVAEMRLQATRRLRVAVDANANGDPAALAAANRILEGAQESKEAALEVGDRLLPVIPESITCISLTALETCASTSVDAMLGLIQMLPSLTKLVIQRLTLDDVQVDISVPGPDESRLAEPLSSKMKDIRIGARFNGPVPEVLVSVVKYLSLRIPTLARFCATDIQRRPIAEFVSACSKQYPHLEGITYELR